MDDKIYKRESFKAGVWAQNRLARKGNWGEVGMSGNSLDRSGQAIRVARTFLLTMEKGDPELAFCGVLTPFIEKRTLQLAAGKISKTVLAGVEPRQECVNS